jgi:hypothetical protein
MGCLGKNWGCFEGFLRDFWGFWRSKNIPNPWVFKRKTIQKDNYNPMGS